MLGERYSQDTAQAHSAQEIKIAAFVCLQDVLRKEPAIATSVVELGLRHSGQSARDLAGLYKEVEPAVRYVKLNKIASAHGRERAASRGLWRGVDDNSAERRAAHAGIADPHHIADTLLE